MQADALEIEAAAKRRLADEYDAAQERGEVQRAGGDRVSKVPDRNNAPPTTADLGLTRKQVHKARSGARRRGARSGQRAAHAGSPLRPGRGGLEQCRARSGMHGPCDKSARLRLKPGSLPALSGGRPAGHRTTRRIGTGLERGSIGGEPRSRASCVIGIAKLVDVSASRLASHVQTPIDEPTGERVCKSRG
jgi:hypothetical protein